jgi:hypothetical protein
VDWRKDCETWKECAITNGDEENGVAVNYDVKQRTSYTRCEVEASISETVICKPSEH